MICWVKKQKLFLFTRHKWWSSECNSKRTYKLKKHIFIINCLSKWVALYLLFFLLLTTIQIPIKLNPLMMKVAMKKLSPNQWRQTSANTKHRCAKTTQKWAFALIWIDASSLMDLMSFLWDPMHRKNVMRDKSADRFGKKESATMESDANFATVKTQREEAKRCQV